jgi:hypothetical protein
MSSETLEPEAQAELDGLAAENAGNASTSSGDNGADAGTEPEHYPYDEQLAQTVEMMAAMVCDALAKRYGAHWRLQADESRELSVTTAQVAHRAFGAVSVSPYTKLVLVAGGVFGPRIAMTAAQQPHEAASDASASSADETSRARGAERPEASEYGHVDY